jgi:hypothetical protein
MAVANALAYYDHIDHNTKSFIAQAPEDKEIE